MEKVKIKRIKRDKKPVTTQSKILAGLGVGGVIMGGAAAAAPKVQAQNIVSTQTNEQSTATSKVKDILNKIFGATVAIPQAKADNGDGQPTSGGDAVNVMAEMTAEFNSMAGDANQSNNVTGSNAGLAQTATSVAGFIDTNSNSNLTPSSTVTPTGSFDSYGNTSEGQATYTQGLTTATAATGQTDTTGVSANPSTVLNYGTSATPTDTTTTTDLSGNVTAVNLNYPSATDTTAAPAINTPSLPATAGFVSQLPTVNLSDEISNPSQTNTQTSAPIDQNTGGQNVYDDNSGTTINYLVSPDTTPPVEPAVQQTVATNDTSNLLDSGNGTTYDTITGEQYFNNADQTATAAPTPTVAAPIQPTYGPTDNSSNNTTDISPDGDSVQAPSNSNVQLDDSGNPVVYNTATTLAAPVVGLDITPAPVAPTNPAEWTVMGKMPNGTTVYADGNGGLQANNPSDPGSIMPVVQSNGTYVQANAFGANATPVVSPDQASTPTAAPAANPLQTITTPATPANLIESAEFPGYYENGNGTYVDANGQIFDDSKGELQPTGNYLPGYAPTPVVAANGTTAPANNIQYVGNIVGTTSPNGVITNIDGSSYSIGNITVNLPAGTTDPNPNSTAVNATLDANLLLQSGNTVNGAAAVVVRTENQIVEGNGGIISQDPNAGGNLSIYAGQNLYVPEVTFNSNENGSATEQITTSNGGSVPGFTYAVTTDNQLVANNGLSGAPNQPVAPGAAAIVLSEMRDNGITQLNGTNLSDIAAAYGITANVGSDGTAALATVTTQTPVVGQEQAVPTITSSINVSTPPDYDGVNKGDTGTGSNGSTWVWTENTWELQNSGSGTITSVPAATTPAQTGNLAGTYNIDGGGTLNVVSNGSGSYTISPNSGAVSFTANASDTQAWIQAYQNGTAFVPPSSTAAAPVTTPTAAATATASTQDATGAQQLYQTLGQVYSLQSNNVPYMADGQTTLNNTASTSADPIQTLQAPTPVTVSFTNVNANPSLPIQFNADGTYTVTTPNNQTVTVTSLENLQSLLGNNSGGNLTLVSNSNGFNTYTDSNGVMYIKNADGTFTQDTTAQFQTNVVAAVAAKTAPVYTPPPAMTLMQPTIPTTPNPTGAPPSSPNVGATVKTNLNNVKTGASNLFGKAIDANGNLNVDILKTHANAGSLGKAFLHNLVPVLGSSPSATQSVVKSITDWATNGSYSQDTMSFTSPTNPSQTVTMTWAEVSGNVTGPNLNQLSPTLMSQIFGTASAPK